MKQNVIIAILVAVTCVFAYKFYALKRDVANGSACPACPAAPECPAPPPCPACPEKECPAPPPPPACPVCPPEKECPAPPPPPACPVCPPEKECPACETCPAPPPPTVCPVCETCPPPTVCPAPPPPTVCPVCATCAPPTVCPVCETCKTCDALSAAVATSAFDYTVSRAYFDGQIYYYRNPVPFQSFLDYVRSPLYTMANDPIRNDPQFSSGKAWGPDWSCINTAQSPSSPESVQRAGLKQFVATSLAYIRSETDGYRRAAYVTSLLSLMYLTLAPMPVSDVRIVAGTWDDATGEFKLSLTPAFFTLLRDVKDPGVMTEAQYAAFITNPLFLDAVGAPATAVPPPACNAAFKYAFELAS